MADKKKVVSAVGHTREIAVHLRPFVDFLGDFNKESERGAALSAAAYVDDLLAQSISAFLVEGSAIAGLMKHPLNTFSARITMAHALGLISDDERQEADAVRKVRNEFAHAVKMSFEDARVRGLCSGLKMAIQDGKATARMQFTSAAVALIVGLINQPAYVGRHRLTAREWEL